MEKTEYYDDFCQYYHKAQQMEKKSLNQEYNYTIDDLVQNVHIYNATIRRNAGFSNVLNDIHNGNDDETTLSFTTIGKQLPFLPIERCNHDIYTMHYLHLVHRITGSGASFEADHGYRNTIIPYLARLESIEEMVEYIKSYKSPIFTSKGNQIPPFNKPNSPYIKGGIEYLCEYAPIISEEYVNYLDKFGGRKIKEAVDFILDIHTQRNMKRYKFVLTAFVMDTAEYYPHLVDPTSHCYIGSNAIEAIELMFINTQSTKKETFYDEVIDYLCFEYKKPDGLSNDPYSMEDVLCDYIRYVENYIPRWYLRMAPLNKYNNNSLIKNHDKSLMPKYEAHDVYGELNLFNH